MMNMMEKVIQTMRAQIEALQQKLDDKHDKKVDKSGIPFLNSKDVEKPSKYDGTAFKLWYQNFAIFLESKDERFGKILDEINERSKSPLTDDAEIAINHRAGLPREAHVEKAFRSQLFQYLQSYTKGEPYTVVLAGGQDRVYESMRQLLDSGNSQQHYSRREERRRLWHPNQTTLDNLKVAIATWENDLALYVGNTDENMDNDMKISCLEDMCPTELQEHLAEKSEEKFIKSYSDYKQAISNYLHKRIRFGKGKSPKLNALTTERNDDDATEEADQAPEDEYTLKELDKLYAMVKGKVYKKGKGKGKDGGKNSGDGTAMDVDPKVCHECGDPNHFVRDCPVRAAKNLAKGKNGKGKGDSKGKGKGSKGAGKYGGVPSTSAWSSYYPGPTPAMWRSWHPGSNAGGKFNLFEQPLQLSSLQPQADAHGLLDSLFAPGNIFKLNVKGPKAVAIDQKPKTFIHENSFAKLASDEDEETSDEETSRSSSSSPTSTPPLAQAMPNSTWKRLRY